MKFRQGSSSFGILLGVLFAGIGLLWITLGFGKTLLLFVLFAVGYFIGGVGDKSQFVKDTVNRVIPEKKNNTIDIRETVAREQAEAVEKENKAEEEE